jgi:hypothetical protein
LTILNFVPLSDRFPSILVCLDAFHRLQFDNPANAIALIIREITNECFLSTFVVLNAFAVKVPTFASLCTDLEQRAWVNLEGAF